MDIRLNDLRILMKEEKLAAYVVPTDDAHQVGLRKQYNNVAS